MTCIVGGTERHEDSSDSNISNNVLFDVVSPSLGMLAASRYIIGF